MLLNPGPPHIEDTNGADTTLQSITEADVVALKMGTRGGVGQSEASLDVGAFAVSSGTKYSSNKFTGVYLLHRCTIFRGSDIHIILTDFEVKQGNFAFYVVLDGKIVGEVQPENGGFAELLIENIEKTATLEYIIAGESAKFNFTVTEKW